MPDTTPATGPDSEPCAVDPRVERSKRVICEAAIAELSEVGYGAMTIESIAKRAGVSKATVYRHWDGKLDLIDSALLQIRDSMHIPTSGTVRERVTVMLTWLAEYLADRDRSGSLPAMISASVYDDSVRAYHYRFNAGRRQALVDLLDEGLASGELSTGCTDATLLAEMLVGPIFYERLMSSEPFDPQRVPEVVDIVLGAV
ncbi:MAG: TetR/AcrR family transcriptional regulator [Ilumatobacter sp.]|jgi:TetR/AcrR family transcriptional regulator, regulator of autoinduction and epiphytic fitness|uniref:TetR/AcrR family transcriptional regulator n=1 Tax=Ilumatobacter sp. TaxID=1967498 RepID=UPI00391CFEEE